MDKSIEAAALVLQRAFNESTRGPLSFQQLARAAVAAYCDAEIERLTAENDKLLGVLEQHGFRRCDIAACNCGSWHHIGGFAARFREIEEATEDYWENGEVLLARIERIVAKLEAAERAARRECLWVNDDDGEVWEGSCGAAWTFIDGGPAENEMKHCPRCGGHLTLDDAEQGGERG